MEHWKRRKRGKRRAGGETQERILAAAREMAIEEGFSRITLERVAERAGVSRMTIYYQFGSRQELLESMFDSFAERGRLDQLPLAFREPDARIGLGRVIAIFCGFWATDPAGLRRLRGWRALEAGEGIVHERDEWRRRGLATLVRRIREAHGVLPEAEAGDVVDVLHSLTSFESYEYLAEAGRSTEEVVRLLQRTAARLLGLEPESLRPAD